MVGMHGWVPGSDRHGAGTMVLGTSHVSPRQGGIFCSWLKATDVPNVLGSPIPPTLQPELSAVSEH